MFKFKGESHSASGVEIWKDAPHFQTWAHPSLFYADSDQVYMTFEAGLGDEHTTVRFEGVVELHVQPFTDESLGSHPFAKFGLKSYEFNLVKDSSKAAPWSSRNHWVITFKDVAVDVLAKRCSIIASQVPAESKQSALLAAANQQP